MVNTNQIVIFGAGKIGRSFIGQLFGCSGYEVVFIDVDPVIIAGLNEKGSYRVVIKSDKDMEILVPNVRAISALEREKVVEAVSSAGILAVSVGKNVLVRIVPVIASALEKRHANDPETPLDIILAENMRSVADFVRKELMKNLPSEFPVERLVGLVETSIGKMVPIIPQAELEKDPLVVFAEAYNTLILDAKGFKSPIPQIKGLSPKSNIKAWVDRKAFIHNLGHATSAYLGFLAHPSCNYLYEVLSDYQLKEKVRNTMLQAANILLMKYPDEFTLESLTEHVDDLLIRFQNKTLGDTLFRVGCDLSRKLGAEDRLAGAIHEARIFKLPSNLILYSLVCGCHFNATDESGRTLQSDREFMAIYAKGIKTVLTSVCGFDEIDDSEVILEAISIDNSLKSLL